MQGERKKKRKNKTTRQLKLKSIIADDHWQFYKEENRMAKGFLHVITSPVSGDIMINGEYRGTKDVNIELEQGTYTVSFGMVSGYITPAQMSITVNPGFVALVTVEYMRQ